MQELHAAHEYFTDQITFKRCIGRYYWPTRAKDTFEFCRSCPAGQGIGIFITVMAIDTESILDNNSDQVGWTALHWDTPISFKDWVFSVSTPL